MTLSGTFRQVFVKARYSSLPLTDSALSIILQMWLPDSRLIWKIVKSHDLPVSHKLRILMALY